MSLLQQVRARRRRRRSAVLVASTLSLIAVVMVVHTLDRQVGLPSRRSPLASPPRTAVDAAPSSHRLDERLRGNAPRVPGGGRSHTLGEADGEVPRGTTVYDDLPAIAHLDPALRVALRLAATDAEADGVEIEVNSGWRSDAYQAALFAQAVATYGSEREAERWVARPGTSVHEAGDAVDLGPSRATTWLADHGAASGLCRTYANEPWHFELRPDARHDGCPAPYADPTRDPRTQR